MFRKISNSFLVLICLSVSTYAQIGGMHLSIQNLTTIPDTILSGEVYEFNFLVTNVGTEAVTTNQEVGIMLSIEHDEAQLVGNAVHLPEILFPYQQQVISIPAYQFDVARCGGGPELDIIVWPTVMKLSNQVKDSIVKSIYYVSSASFRVENSFVTGLNNMIDLNATYDVSIHAQNSGLEANLNDIEFFVQIDKRQPIILDAIKTIVPVGDMVNISIQSFKLADIDKNFVLDNTQNHFLTIGARELGKSNASQKAVYGIRAGTFPVELLSFEARPLLEQNQIALTWATAVETNNKEFRIEKYDTKRNEFVAVGIVASQGNSASPQNYNLFDKQPDLGKNAYRIAQVDVDGTVRILKNIEILYELDEPFNVLAISPNPSKDNLNFDLFINNSRQELSIEIYSLDGRRMIATKTAKQSGSLSYDVDISQLIEGMYIYKVSGLYKNVTGKFIKE